MTTVTMGCWNGADGSENDEIYRKPVTGPLDRRTNSEGRGKL